MTDAAQQEALTETVAEEGFRANAYKDTEGRWTFSSGRCLETDPLTGAEWKMLLDRGYLQVEITREGADLLEGLKIAALTARLAHDYADFWERLNGPRKAALLEWAYQIGADGEEAFHDTIAALRRAVGTNDPHDWAVVEQNGLSSHWATQTPARAHRVMAQLASGVEQT